MKTIATTIAVTVLVLAASSMAPAQTVNHQASHPGYGIDNILLTSVPEPSTLTLLGCGLVSLAACAWRKCKYILFQKSFTIFLKRVLIAFGIVALAVRCSNAVQVAFDDFNYNPAGASLNGSSGGGSFGFSDTWTGDSSFTIGNGSLMSPTGLPASTGNSTSAVAFGANRDIVRTLSSSLGTPNTTDYFSFLMRPDGILHQGFADGWFGFVLRGDTSTFVDMGSFSNQYGVEVGGTSDLTNTTAVVGKTVLFVLRIDFTAGVDPVYLYVNPPVGNEPVTPSAEVLSNNVGTVSTVDLTGPGAYSFDTLTIGTTWADVAPVPEPPAAMLGALALVAFLGWGPMRSNQKARLKPIRISLARKFGFAAVC